MNIFRTVVAVYAASLVVATVASIGGFGLQSALHCSGGPKGWGEPCRLGSIDITTTMFSMQLGLLYLFLVALPLGGVLFVVASFKHNH